MDQRIKNTWSCGDCSYQCYKFEKKTKFVLHLNFVDQLNNEIYEKDF